MEQSDNEEVALLLGFGLVPGTWETWKETLERDRDMGESTVERLTAFLLTWILILLFSSQTCLVLSVPFLWVPAR